MIRKLKVQEISIPAVVSPPVTGDGDELQQELDTGQPVEDLGGLPVQQQWTVLYEELHHLHHLLAAVVHRLVGEKQA